MSGPLAFLAALQLGDSLFPSGGFTLSHGLETLAAAGLVQDADSLAAWLETTLACQVGPSDGVAGAAAWVAADDLDTLLEIDAQLVSLKLAREPREASLRGGRQLLSTAAELFGPALGPYRAAVRAGQSPGGWPVALGLVARAAGIERRDTVLLLLHLHVSTVLGAALRLVDVDHVEAQKIRHALASCLAATAEAALRLPWKEMYACAPQTELMSILHERAPVRLFAS